MESYILKGLVIGLIFGLPAGVSGTITIQKTLERGFWSGFFTGMGATVSDMFYASVAAFGIHIIYNFLTTYMTQIQLVGGVVIIAYGIYTIFKKSTVNEKVAGATGILSCFLTALGIAILNPASILAYMIGFTLFGVAEAGALTFLQAFQLVAFLGLGTVIWWVFVSGLVTLLRQRITEKTNHRLHMVFGVLTLILGCICIVRSFVPEFPQCLFE